jgi:type II secretory pathway pseudopilin PulG
MSCRSGYIMIEMMVAIAIVILLAGITCAHVGSYRYTCMQQQIALFTLAWRQLQQSAIAGNQQQDMLFDEVGNRYKINGVWRELPSTIRFGFLLESKGPPSNPTHEIHSAITFPGKKVTSFPDGTIQAGTVYLIDDQKQSMYALTSGVSAISFLRKYRYDGTWHEY